MAHEREGIDRGNLEAPDRQTVADEVREAILAGETLVNRGKFRAAIRIWRDLLDRYEQFLEAREEQEIRSRIAAAYFERSQLSLKGPSPNRKSIGRGMMRLEQALRWDAENKEYLFEMGRCHWVLGDLEKAERWFHKAAEAAPDDARIVYALALSRLLLGRPQETLELLRSMELRPSSSGAPGAPTESSWQRLAALATAAAGDTEKALRMLVQRPKSMALGLWVDDVVSIALAGAPSEGVCESLEAMREGLLKLGEPGEAARIARILGDMRHALGDDEKAVGAWVSARWKNTEPLPDLTKVISACERRALKALAEESYDEAERWCLLGQEAQRDEPVTRRILAATHTLRGNCRWRAAQADLAVEAWSKSLDVAPSVAAAWNLAIAREASGDWRAAAGHWRSVLKIAEEQGDRPMARAAARRMTLAHVRAGELELAIRGLRHALQLGDDVSDRLALGYLLAAANHAEEAVSVFQGLVGAVEEGKVQLGLAIACEAGNTGIETRAEQWRKALGAGEEDKSIRAVWRRHTIALGMQAWKENDYQGAMRRFAELLLEDRYDVDGWIWCGALHLDQGREDRAKDCFDQALIAGGEESADTFVKLGGRYLAAGRQQSANQLFSKALKASASPRTHRLIAEACFEAERPDIAFEHLREGVRRSAPDDTEVFAILYLAATHLSEKADTLSLCHEALNVTSEPEKVKLLVAAHHLRNQEWRNAQDVLEELDQLARERGDRTLKMEVETFFRALILPLTIGRADSSFDVDAHIARLLAQWAFASQGASGDPDASVGAWLERAAKTAQSILEDSVGDVELCEPEIDFERPRLAIETPRFERGLNLAELVAREPVF